MAELEFYGAPEFLRFLTNSMMFCVGHLLFFEDAIFVSKQTGPWVVSTPFLKVSNFPHFLGLLPFVYGALVRGNKFA